MSKMGQKRQRYTQDFKVRVISEALRGERSTQEIAAAYKVDRDLLARWKREYIKKGEQGGFVNKKTLEKLKNSFFKKEANLQRKIDFMKKQLAWLKRKTEEILTREERLALIEKHGCELTPFQQAQLLNVDHTSAFYRSSSIRAGSFQLLKSGTAV